MEIKCNKCGSKRIKKHMVRKNKSQWKNVYRCLNCKHIFTPDDGFWKKKFSPLLIMKAVELHNRFHRKYVWIREYFWRTEHVKPSKTTLSRWSKKYKNIKNQWGKWLGVRDSEFKKEIE